MQMTDRNKINKETDSDEIDLIHLLAKGVFAIKNNFRKLFIAFLLGTVGGGIFFQFSPEVFESKMIIHSDILIEPFFEKIAESFENLIGERNQVLIAKRFGLTESEANTITNIKIESVRKTKSPNAEKSDDITFVITIRCLDNSIYPKLEKGIIEYLRNNEFVKIRVKQRVDYYQEMIRKIELEIRSLDSLKGRLFAGKAVYAKSAEMMLVDPTSIYTQIIELTKEQLNFKNSLQLFNSIQLVEGFTIYEKPVSPKLSLSIAGGATLGLFFVILLIGFKSLRRLIQASEEKLAQDQDASA